MQAIIDERLKMKDINGQVTTYVEKKIPFYRHWNKKDLKSMIQFFSDLGQLIVHQNSKGKVDGVLALRLPIGSALALEDRLDRLGLPRAQGPLATGGI